MTQSDCLVFFSNKKKPWLDLLLVLVMFGGFRTCVTKMVVVPFLFLIYWCAFLVEFQELNFRFCPNLTPDKVDPKLTWPMIPFSKKCILTGSIMKLNLEQPQLLIWFSIQVNLSLETKTPFIGTPNSYLLTWTSLMTQTLWLANYASVLQKMRLFQTDSKWKIQKSFLPWIIIGSVYETRWNSLLGLGSIVPRRRRCIRMVFKKALINLIGYPIIIHSETFF